MRRLIKRYLIFWRSLWMFELPGGQAKIRIQQPLIWIAFIPVFFWYLISPTGVSAMSTAALGGLLLLGYYWARTMALKVFAFRHLRYTAFQVGDQLEEELRLENASYLPVLWAEFIDQSHIPGYTIADVRSVGSRNYSEWTASTICERRGLYHLGPWAIHLGDPFGLFLVEQTYDQQEEIVVYPPIAVLPPTLLPHSGDLGSQRPLRQPLHAETILATTARPHQFGDPLRHIHWPTTARMGKLYVRQFDPEASSKVWLLVDLDTSVQVGDSTDSTLEWMMILTASLASRYLQDQLAVGLIAFPDIPFQPVLPQRGTAHLWTILRSLAPLQSSRQTLSEGITRTASIVPAQDLLVIITPSVNSTWVKTLRGLRQSRRNAPIQVILLDPNSFTPKENHPFGKKSSAEVFRDDLLASGILTNLISKDDIQPIKGSFGLLRRWEFIAFGTGRVIARQSPREASGTISHPGRG